MNMETEAKKPADATIQNAETPAAQPETPAAEQPSYESLRLMLDDALAKADASHDLALRTRAELENMRRRGERELEKARKYALETFFQELLPVRDSLDMGLSAAQTSADAGKLKEGMQLTLQMLDAAMAKFGLKEINPLGQPFNPEWHQAMTMQPSTEFSPNTVSAVYQKGYALNDRLVRPARVVVAKAPEGAAPVKGSVNTQA